MMQRKIKTSLVRAIDQLPHKSFEDIESVPIKKMTEQEYIACQKEETRTKKESQTKKEPQSKKIYRRRFAVAFACFAMLLVVGIGGYQQNFMVDSYINIDVNPSFEITVNRQDKVLAIKALDEEAEEFVHGKTFRGRTVDEAVETLFSELSESKYMSIEKNAVLISVYSRNTEHISQIEKEMTSHIEKVLSVVGVKPRVIYQSIDGNMKNRHEAQEYHTSSGKLQLAKHIKEGIKGYSLKQLVEMPMWQLLGLVDDIDDIEGIDDIDDADVEKDEIDDNYEDDESDKDSDNEDNDSDDDEKTTGASPASMHKVPLKDEQNDNKGGSDKDGNDKNSDDTDSNDGHEESENHKEKDEELSDAADKFHDQLDALNDKKESLEELDNIEEQEDKIEDSSQQLDSPNESNEQSE